jgi:hypothetical protein
MFHKLSVLLLTLLASFTLFAQRADFPSSVTNKATAKHKPVPGTRLFMIFPNNFEAALGFPGLESSDRKAEISVLDVPGGNFFSDIAEFSKESFEKRGAKVFEFKELLFEGYPARFIHVQGDNFKKGYGLVFGDSTFSVVLMGLYPEANQEEGEQIRSSILSCVYDKTKKTNLQELSKFKVDESKSIYNFSSLTAGTFIYSRSGINKTRWDLDSVICFMQIPFDKTKTLKTISEEGIVRMQQNGLMNFRIDKAGPTRINGCDAYESEISGSLKDVRAVNYLLVIHLKPDLIVLVQGMSKNNHEQNISEIKKLAYTVRAK